MMDQKARIFENYVRDGMTTENMMRSLELIGAPIYDEETLESMKIYSDYLPMMKEDPYTQEQRYLHILWEAIDTVPLGINCKFSIPFRRIIAEKLFKHCGTGFVAAPHCSFNFGHRIEVGDYVAWNMGCFIDSKGTVTFGDNAMMAEKVTIFTHGNKEDNHMERVYKPVHIGKEATLFCGCTILGGVTIGDGAEVGVGSVVTRDVAPNTVAAGSPAKFIRDCRHEDGTDINHFFFNERAFQKDLERYRRD